MNRSFVEFLGLQREQGLRLAAESDVVELLPMPVPLPQKYVVRFRCRGFVRDGGGEVSVAERHEVGVYFPEDYLRRANFLEVLTWFGPTHAFHPNIHGPAMKICPGPLAPGTPLVDLLYQIYEVITCYRVNMREFDCLNPAACPWARANQHRFPVDERPLKRREAAR